MPTGSHLEVQPLPKAGPELPRVAFERLQLLEGALRLAGVAAKATFPELLRVEAQTEGQYASPN